MTVQDLQLTEFSGAKLAVFLGGDLLVIRRDDRPDIPYPHYWDLPGGGREGNETPIECALRETREEVGLDLAPSDLSWSHSYSRPRGMVWFFAAHLPRETVNAIRFGDEGKGWRLMLPRAYQLHPLGVPHFKEQLCNYMNSKDFPG